MILVKRNLFLILLLTLTICNAQLPFYGKVVDSETKQGIPFVNIGFVDLGIGTVSNEEGKFLLEFDPTLITENAVLQLSSLGYETKKIEYANSDHLINRDLVVYMKPKELELMEVEVYNDGQEFINDNVGYRNFGEEYFGYWKDDMALGGELATRVIVRDGLRKLHTLEFMVKENISDSLLLRMNFYDDDGGIYRMPGTNINKSGKDILYVLKAGQESILIDLDPFDIIVNDDFIVSLELVDVYGNSPPGLALEASYNGFGSYRRYTSQDKWVKFSPINMAYYLKTSLLVSKREAVRYEVRKDKRSKRRRTVSGFAIANSVMIADVLVRNLRTRETVYTDKLGRYSIHARKGDILSFQKSGFQVFSQMVKSDLAINVSLRRAIEEIDDKGLKPAIPLN